MDCDQQLKVQLEVSSAPQGSILRTTLFKVFVNSQDSGTKRTFSVFTGDIKLRGMADTPEGCTAVQKSFSKKEKWAERNLMKLNQVLHLGRNNALHQYRIEANWLKSTSAEKVVRILVDS